MFCIRRCIQQQRRKHENDRDQIKRPFSKNVSLRSKNGIFIFIPTEILFTSGHVQI